MALMLNELCEELKLVRKYLVKIGPSRRQGQILQVKLNETNAIFDKYTSWLLEFRKQVSEGKISSATLSLYENSCRSFELLHSEILGLCSEGVERTSISEMDTFDLKTALTLLPVMTNDETSIKQLIDNIQYYSSLLSKSQCKNNLIQFVLKSRLSQAAKIRLQDNYSSVDELITDMRKQLLPSKGATAIQKRLHNIKQNDMSISDFGKEIAELFVDLTIAQADGNTSNYNVLKPINEKQAIKQFSDGLRNRRLSTLIAARNFGSLKDAIQAAKDEETFTPSTSGEVMGMYKTNYYNSRNFHSNARGFRGGPNGQTYSYRRPYAGFRGNSQRGWQPSTSRGQGQHRGRGRQTRGTFFRSYRRNRGQNHSVNVLNENNENNINSEAEPRLDQFFRE